MTKKKIVGIPTSKPFQNNVTNILYRDPYKHVEATIILKTHLKEKSETYTKNKSERQKGIEDPDRLEDARSPGHYTDENNNITVISPHQTLSNTPEEFLKKRVRKAYGKPLELLECRQGVISEERLPPIMRQCEKCGKHFAGYKKQFIPSSSHTIRNIACKKCAAAHKL